MSDGHELLEMVHILSASVLFGSGAAIAFFMYMGWRSGDAAGFSLASKHVVLADWVFTTTAVIVQPISGYILAQASGWPLDSPWLLVAYGLYIFIGLCWLPVVWIQLKVRKQVKRAAEEDGPIPDQVNKLMQIWFILGWPAFIALIAIFYLMIAKPSF